MNLAILQENNRWQAGNVVFIREFRFLIKIDFKDDRPASILLGQIFKDWRERFTGVSPVCVKVQ